MGLLQLACSSAGLAAFALLPGYQRPADCLHIICRCRTTEQALLAAILCGQPAGSTWSMACRSILVPGTSLRPAITMLCKACSNPQGAACMCMLLLRQQVEKAARAATFGVLYRHAALPRAHSSNAHVNIASASTQLWEVATDTTLPISFAKQQCVHFCLISPLETGRPLPVFRVPARPQHPATWSTWTSSPRSRSCSA